MSKSSYNNIRDYEEKERIPGEIKRLSNVINTEYNDIYIDRVKKNISANNLIELLHKGNLIDKNVKDFELPLITYASRLYNTNTNNKTISKYLNKKLTKFFIDPFNCSYSYVSMYAQEHNMDPVTAGEYKNKRGLDYLFYKTMNYNPRKSPCINNKFFIKSSKGDKEVKVKEKIESMIGKDIFNHEEINRISNNYNQKVLRGDLRSQEDILNECIIFEISNHNGRI